MTVRFHFFAVLFVIFGVMPAHGAQEPFSIRIRALHDVVKVGDDVHVAITLTNTSDQAFRIGRAIGNEQAELDYVIDVRDKNAFLALKTEYGHTVAGEGNYPLFTSARSVTLKPGEQLEEESILNKIYDLGHPGSYVVQVHRDIPEQIGYGVATSNAITVTVTE